MLLYFELKIRQIAGDCRRLVFWLCQKRALKELEHAGCTMRRTNSVDDAALLEALVKSSGSRRGVSPARDSQAVSIIVGRQPW